MFFFFWIIQRVRFNWPLVWCTSNDFGKLTKPTRKLTRVLIFSEKKMFAVSLFSQFLTLEVPQDFWRILRSFWKILSGYRKVIRYHNTQRDLEEAMPNFIFRTLPSDGLVIGARTSACKLMTKFWSCIYSEPALEGKNDQSTGYSLNITSIFDWGRHNRDLVTTAKYKCHCDSEDLTT